MNHFTAFFCREKFFLSTILFAAYFLNCHSLPPSEPAVSDEFLDLRRLSWEKASMPNELPGDWYSEGKLELTITGDTLYVNRFRTQIFSIAKSDSYYRIIYNVETMYFTVYFHALTNGQVQVKYASNNATDPEGAIQLPVGTTWLTLTSTNPWIPASIPAGLLGNWHIYDGYMELAIIGRNVVIDGAAWDIDTVQTNRHFNRLILKMGDKYKSLYFEETGEYEMEILLVDGQEDIQDRLGEVKGDWKKIYRWWDFIENGGFIAGSRWYYAYSYQQYINKVIDISTPIDSSVQIDSLKGWLDLVVSNNTISNGTGSITIQATFQIDEEKERYYHSQKDSTVQVLADSVWTILGSVKTVQYEIYPEDDTLWYRTDGGKIFFTSRKVQPGALFNLRAFIYPFEFPKEGFPDGADAIGKIVFPDEKEPFAMPFSDTEMSISLPGKNIIVYGQMTNNYAYFSPGTGFQLVNYWFGDNDQRFRYGYGEYSNPYIKETSFSCQIH